MKRLGNQPTRPSKYPWDDWFDEWSDRPNLWHKLHYGLEYECKSKTMASLVRHHALHRDVVVDVRWSEWVVDVKFVKGESR